MVTKWMGSLLLVTQLLLLRHLDFVHLAQAHTREAQPVLAAKHDGSHILITCTIDHAKRDSEVYFSCPALGTNTDCYQGCKPTQLCPPSTSTSASSRDRTGCVPHGETVRCQKAEFANGTVTVSLTIDQRDSRLAGRWYCTHAGRESVPYTVLQQEHRTNPAPESATASRKVVAAASREPKETSNFRRPAVVYTILSVLGLSLIINMAFCVRCVLMRSYIDSINAGESADCIATTLCLPREVRKPMLSNKEPLLPRSAGWGTLPPIDPASPYHRSTPVIHQINNPSLFMQHNPYAPGGSTAGSYRAQTSSQHRLYRPVPQSDFIYNRNIDNMDSFNVPPQMIYQPIDGAGGPQHGTPMSNGLPSFLRNPSVNLPSPNPSQRCYFVNNSPPRVHRVPMGAENQMPYFVQQPGTFAGQVIYDDVSALAAMNQASTGSVQNGAVQNYDFAGVNTAQGFAPFTQLYAIQPEMNNNQSAGASPRSNRNTLADHPAGSGSTSNPMTNAGAVPSRSTDG